MKKLFQVLLPIVLVIAIITCMCWYLLIYDRDFTRDVLLSGARYFESQGNHTVATWFYNTAYLQSEDSDAVAIELAQQYKNSGNYTKAEYTLTSAISDGAGADVYIALCKTFVEQDKLLDAVNMLDSVTNPDIKAQLEALRPTAPVTLLTPGLYNDYMHVDLQAQGGSIYASVNTPYPSTSSDLYGQSITLIDGENTVQAITVAENGLVSSLSVFHYVVGGVIKEVEFSDATMEAAIREQIGAAGNTVLYTNDLWGITSFTVPEGVEVYADLLHLPYLQELNINKGISGQLHYISQLTNLNKLTITGTAVEEDLLHSIGEISTLTELTLSGCDITSITELEDARNLKLLDLTDNAIRNISSISLMQDLETLRLARNAVTDVSALAVLSKLSVLDISYNSITALDPITSVKTLTWLNAQNNQLSQINGFDQLTGLTYLSLASNTITDVSLLGKCTALTELDISDNTITDITALSALQLLMDLNFSNNQVTELPQWDTACSLVTIDGSNNQLTSLAPLSGLECLNNVYMDYNTQITSVAELADCPTLINVNIYGTSVKDVTMLTKQSIIVNYDPTVGE